MALKHPRFALGRTVILDHDSAILRASIPHTLGDSPRRKLAVWLPPQYDAAHRHRVRDGDGGQRVRHLQRKRGGERSSHGRGLLALARQHQYLDRR